MELSTECFADGSVCIKVSGFAICTHDFTQLKKLAETIRPPKLILDFSKCDFLDSKAVGTILYIYRKMSHNGGKLSIVGLKQTLFTLFTTIKLDQIINLEQHTLME